MTSPRKILPNELADLYESLYTMLDTLPSNTHPAWELAIESVLFGGEGLAPESTNYGKQQAERNDFRISDYRAQYGDGERVLDFPTLTTRSPSDQDQQYVDEEVQLPVAPESGTVLPLDVDANTLPNAISLLNELPTAPSAQTSKESTAILLNPDRFPGLTSPSSKQSNKNPNEDTKKSFSSQAGLPPNELADIYDALYTVFEAIPDTAHPCWKEAIKSILFGGEYLRPGANAYGEQQGERNGFGMPEYRTRYGNGDRVTEFPTIQTAQPLEDDTPHVDAGINLPVAPDSGIVLPVAPTVDSLSESLHLLEELPATPDADIELQSIDSLLDIDALIADFDDVKPVHSTDTSSDNQSTSIGRTDPQQLTTRSNPATDSDTKTTQSTEQVVSGSTNDNADSPNTESTILRDETVGESTFPLEEQDTSRFDGSTKYDDSEAERAHRRAQQRDPSDVVELGDEIKLTLKQVDYSSHPPTIMGTKNRLVIFVIDAPQDLSQYDTIRARVVDYGGENNSAEVAFSGYVK